MLARPSFSSRSVHRWPVTLEHGELVLRPLRRADQIEWEAVRSRNRDWLAPWEATNPEPGTGARTFREVVRLLNRQGREGAGLPWLICVHPRSAGGSAGRPATAAQAVITGQLSVSMIMRGSAQSASVGYWVDRGWAGRGLAPTAVALASDYAFQVMGLHRMELNIRPENDRSRRVAEKLGFRHEGVRRAYLHIDGDWRDHDAYALTAPEVPDGLLARLGDRH